MPDKNRIALACDRAGIMSQTETEAEKNPYQDRYTPIHCLFAEFRSRWCGCDKCIHKDGTEKYYQIRCIPALCFVQWLAKEGIVEIKEAELARSAERR